MGLADLLEIIKKEFNSTFHYERENRDLHGRVKTKKCTDKQIEKKNIVKIRSFSMIERSSQLDDDEFKPKANFKKI